MLAGSIVKVRDPAASVRGKGTTKTYEFIPD